MVKFTDIERSFHDEIEFTNGIIREVKG